MAWVHHEMRGRTCARRENRLQRVQRRCLRPAAALPSGLTRKLAGRSQPFRPSTITRIQCWRLRSIRRTGNSTRCRVNRRNYKFDIAYSDRSDIARQIAEVVKIDPGSDTDVSAAQALLKGWDRRANIGSRAAALAVLMRAEAAHSDSHPDVPPIDALRHAIKTLKTHFGRIDPEWSSAVGPAQYSAGAGRRNN
jgi:hypothetical protein